MTRAERIEAAAREADALLKDIAEFTLDRDMLEGDQPFNVCDYYRISDAIDALRAALAEPEPSVEGPPEAFGLPPADSGAPEGERLQVTAIDPEEGSITVERAEPEEPSEFQKTLEQAVNRHSKENGSDTPDFILAAYLEACLVALDAAVNARRKWWGKQERSGFGNLCDPPGVAEEEMRLLRQVARDAWAGQDPRTLKDSLKALLKKYPDALDAHRRARDATGGKP